MDSRKEVQHVYLVGAKSLGAYGGYETFVYKLTEYHQNKENIKYHMLPARPMVMAAWTRANLRV
ncbi:MAG: DUF1972 domain-containing protein [Blautia massiliensis (ex Durand et al. 2017)]|uniref:DUF1972 domain-containing protein n=1 Tax=Blautia massiliensis (ex Durand et al. 2017) TaxID=1737424 RepID=UPI00399D1FB3